MAVRMPLSLLKEITCDFSNERILGSGTFGVVYKGIFENGEVAAVKRLINNQLDLDDVQFEKEVKPLLGLRHKNIVQLRGYCAESSKEFWVQGPETTGRDKQVLAEIRESRLLCLEYVPNKSLRQHISDASCGLEWNERYGIIRGICSGLAYLHKRNIVHMDLKPENILLDKNKVPKIVDFGASRLIDPNKSRDSTRNLIGTLGYMAPEHIYLQSISPKADLFSLGIIILELMTGSKPEFPLREGSLPPYPSEVVRKWKGRLSNAVYSEQIRTCVFIAQACVYFDEASRPAAASIIERLDEVDYKAREKLNEVPYKTETELISEVQESTSSWSLVGTTTNEVMPPIMRAAKLIKEVIQQESTGSWSQVETTTNKDKPEIMRETKHTDEVIQQEASSTWSLVKTFVKKKWLLVKTFRNITIVVVVLVFILQLGLGSSLSWVVPTLKVLTALVTFRATGMLAACVAISSPNPRRWPRLTLLLSCIGCIMAAGFAILNNSSAWSWVVITTTAMKAVTPITLFAIGFMGALIVDYEPMNIWSSSCPRRALLILEIKAVVTTVLGVLAKPSIPWSWVVITTAVVIKASVVLAAIGLVATILSWISLPWGPGILRICISIAFVQYTVVEMLFIVMFAEVCVLCREILALIQFFRRILQQYFFWQRILPGKDDEPCVKRRSRNQSLTSLQ